MKNIYTELYWKIKRHFTVFENLKENDFDIIIKEIQEQSKGRDKNE